MTRCRAGDRAFVIEAAQPENLHLLVLVHELLEPVPSQIDGLLVFIVPIDGGRYNEFEVGSGAGPVWLVESLGRPFVLQNELGRPISMQVAPCRDVCLRPIRDQPGDDETLRIAGLPKETTLQPKPQREFAR